MLGRTMLTSRLAHSQSGRQRLQAISKTTYNTKVQQKNKVYQIINGKPKSIFPEDEKGSNAISIPSSAVQKLKETFLPVGYPQATHPNYTPYAQWLFVHNILGSACSVLSTQSLLFAVGLSSGAIPLAASLNWIIKDGLGQLGGVLYISKLGHLFDVETKRLRFQAAIMMSVASFLELLTPLMPHLFLPIASLSNIAKNISWLASSATRAQIHNNFAMENNLGDITGKSGSQNTAAGLIGTGLGILVSSFIGDQPSLIISSFIPIAICSILASYKSNCFIISDILNHQRAEYVILEYLQSRRILTPLQVSQKESFVMKYKSSHFDRIVLEPPLSKLLKRGVLSMRSIDDSLQQLNLQNPENYFIIHENDKLYLFFNERCTVEQIVKGVFHCYYVAIQKNSGPSDVFRLHSQVKEQFPQFYSSLLSAGWSPSESFLAKKKRRIVISEK